MELTFKPTSKLGRIARRFLRTPVLLVLATLWFWLLFRGGYWFYHRQEQHFQRVVRVGMTENQVFQAVGAPKELIAPGGKLEYWGGHSPRLVIGKTWVYYVGPGGIDRLAVVFIRGKVARVIHDST
jgi:hypothetical protein